MKSRQIITMYKKKFVRKFRKGMVIFVANVVLYLIAKQNVALSKEDVELSDVASVYCEDEIVRAKAESLDRKSVV